MLDKIFSADVFLLFVINREWSNPVCDAVMPWLRNKLLWAPLYVFIIGFLLLNYKRRGFLALFYLMAVIVFCDQISSAFLKPLIERIRPCNDLLIQDYVRLLVNCGSGFSFPSSHAANHFGAAVFLGILSRNFSRIIFPVLIFWAATISYAQVYVGLHYPTDIAGGAALGSFIGAIMVFLFNKHANKIL